MNKINILKKSQRLKSEIRNPKQITNYKSQIPNHKQISMIKISNFKNISYSNLKYCLELVAWCLEFSIFGSIRIGIIGFYEHSSFLEN